MKTLFHCSGFTCWNCFLLAYQTRYFIFPFTAVQEHTPHFKETSCILHSKQTGESNWTQFLNYLHFRKNTFTSFFFFRVVQHLSLPGAMLLSVIQSAVWKRYLGWAWRLTIHWCIYSVFKRATGVWFLIPARYLVALHFLKNINKHKSSMLIS